MMPRRVDMQVLLGEVRDKPMPVNGVDTTDILIE